MKIIVDIFSGFLGSGKTMLIKKFLTENVYGKNTVIIENEFGEISIDGEILRENDIEIKEINSGCICCQVSGKFDDAVLEVINKYKPQNIIIEPSGVAKLSEIINILTNIKFSHMLEIRNVFTLVDVRNYDNYSKNFKEFYENQIRNGHTIVLSRTQSEDYIHIEKVAESIKKYNEKAKIICEPWDKLKAEDFLRDNKINVSPSSNKYDIKSINRSRTASIKKNQLLNTHKADEIFESYPIPMDKCISTEELKSKFKFISENNCYGNVIRAKGIIETKCGKYYQFDYVPSEFKIREIRWSNKKVISIIGMGLDKKSLNNFFR